VRPVHRLSPFGSKMPALMPQTPHKDDVDETWTFLEKGINSVMLNLDQGVDMKTYMALYTYATSFFSRLILASTDMMIHQCRP
jgi:hypothetical protein